MSYKKFKKKYSYFYSLDEHSREYTLGNEEISVLKVYLKAKEFELEAISEFENTYLKTLSDEKKVIQLVKLLLQIPKQNKIKEDWEMILFFRGRMFRLEQDFGEKKFYEIIENNFSKKEIYELLRMLLYNWEFECYDTKIDLQLKKVDEVNNELSNIKCLDEKISVEHEGLSDYQK